MIDFSFPVSRRLLVVLGICLILLPSVSVFAQEPAAAEKLDEELAAAAAPDTVETPKGSTVFLPVLGYTPEQIESMEEQGLF